MSLATTDITVDDLYDSADENCYPFQLQQCGVKQQHCNWMWLGDVELEDGPLKKLLPTAIDMGSQSSSAESEKKNKSKQVTEPFKPPRQVSQSQQTVALSKVAEVAPPPEPADDLSQSSKNDTQDCVGDSGVDGGRVLWTELETTLLLDGYNQVKASSSVRNGFKRNQHTSVAKFISANDGRHFSARQVQQKYDRVKKGYRAKKKITNASGGGWDASADVPFFEKDTGPVQLSGPSCSAQVGPGEAKAESCFRQEQQDLQDQLFKSTRATGEHAKVTARIIKEGDDPAEKVGGNCRVPLSEVIRLEGGDAVNGGFISDGLAVESGEGVQSNLVAAGVVTGLAAVKAGLGATAAIKAAAEGAAAALKSTLREKRECRGEVENVHKRKKTALSDSKLQQSVDKMAEVGRMWNDSPQAALSRHLTGMNKRGKISGDEMILLMEFFMATSGQTKVHDYVQGLEDDYKDRLIMSQVVEAQQWLADGKPLIRM